METSTFNGSTFFNGYYINYLDENYEEIAEDKKSANFEAPNLVYTRLLLASLGEGNGNPLQCSCLENPVAGMVKNLHAMQGTWV